MTRAVYNLYIDESGSFLGPGQPSVVCGVLEDTAAGIDWAAVRGELGRVLPLFDYPFHAAELNSPSAWLAAVLRRPESTTPTRLEQAARRACRRVVGALAEAPKGDSALDDFRAAVAADRAPDFATLALVDAWLRRSHSACYRELSTLTDELRARLADTFRHLFQRYRSGELVGAAAVAQSSEGFASDEAAGYSSDSPMAVRLDAYVRALETLFERVLCLHRGSSPCRIDLFVATRHVETRGFGALDLGREAIRQIAERAQAFPRLGAALDGATGEARDVMLTTARGIVRFDAGAPVGLVIADFLSNRLYHKLRGHRAASLTSVCAQLSAAMSLPLSCAPADPSATAPLSTLCADGLARARVRDAYAGRRPSERDVSPRWNREQAGQWIAFASESTRERHG